MNRDYSIDDSFPGPEPDIIVWLDVRNGDDYGQKVRGEEDEKEGEKPQGAGVSFYAGVAVASVVMLYLPQVLGQWGYEQDGGGQEQEERNNQQDQLLKCVKLVHSCIKSLGLSAVSTEMQQGE